jgi:hypothetical protein
LRQFVEVASEAQASRDNDLRLKMANNFLGRKADLESAESSICNRKTLDDLVRAVQAEIPQNKILRYGRFQIFQICVTIDTAPVLFRMEKIRNLPYEINAINGKPILPPE